MNSTLKVKGENTESTVTFNNKEIIINADKIDFRGQVDAT